MYHSWMSLNAFFCPVLNRNSKSDCYESSVIFLPAIKQIIRQINTYTYYLVVTFLQGEVSCSGYISERLRCHDGHSNENVKI